MADEEEPKKKSGLITILIFVVAGFILVAVGLGVGYLIFGGSQNTPQDIANEIVTKQNGEKGSSSEDEDCERKMKQVSVSKRPTQKRYQKKHQKQKSFKPFTMKYLEV